ncbi:hypothetical protein F5B18DRAFT_556514 [Nemania serpens]|nr:hypothetical protein F5B18DRAFT_556514 [Nemania serpens]
MPPSPPPTQVREGNEQTLNPRRSLVTIDWSDGNQVLVIRRRPPHSRSNSASQSPPSAPRLPRKSRPGPNSNLNRNPSPNPQDGGRRSRSPSRPVSLPAQLSAHDNGNNIHRGQNTPWSWPVQPQGAHPHSSPASRSPEAEEPEAARESRIGEARPRHRSQPQPQNSSWEVASSTWQSFKSIYYDPGQTARPRHHHPQANTQQLDHGAPAPFPPPGPPSSCPPSPDAHYGGANYHQHYHRHYDQHRRRRSDSRTADRRCGRGASRDDETARYSIDAVVDYRPTSSTTRRQPLRHCGRRQRHEGERRHEGHIHVTLREARSPPRRAPEDIRRWVYRGSEDDRESRGGGRRDVVAHVDVDADIIIRGDDGDPAAGHRRRHGGSGGFFRGLRRCLLFTGWLFGGGHGRDHHGYDEYGYDYEHDYVEERSRYRYGSRSRRGVRHCG